MLPLQIPCYMLFTRFYFKLGSFTPYEYLEYRYDATVRGVVSISAFYSRVMYIGMVLYTTSKIFEAIYSWPAWFTILFVGCIGIGYTVLGGMKAVVWTDVIQFVVLFGGMIVIIVVLCCNISGGMLEAVAGAFREGHGAPQYLQPEFYTLNPYVRLLFWLLLWNAVVSAVGGAASDQINIQRLLSTKNWQAGFKSQIISSVIGMIACAMLYFIGFAVFTYYHQNPDPTLGAQAGDIAFFHFVATKLPAPLPGIFMAALLAAIMSTLDSGINSMAAIWLKEIHQKFINKNLTGVQEVRVSRVATLFVGCFAILLGLAINFSGKWLEQSVAEVGTIFYILGSATLPPFLLAVLTKRANSKLIWAYTFLSLGEVIGKNLWYVLSRTDEQAWQRDHSLGLGWTGPLDIIYFLVPLILGLLLCVPWLFSNFRTSIATRIITLTGISMLGVACALGMWYFYSNALITDIPKARSFSFFLPLSFIATCIAACFMPIQPRHKYQGLTLATLNDPLLKPSEKSDPVFQQIQKQ
eukprot:TRINITY_DN16283_c0_g1_i1.p1 TRINITY_DN16283_c0_g1~~TRINITY_DN16283_c0_g1_i1.p1  ORF type:complete len:524 (+),score=19.15 TRINITY_DN16283_c0_g1_i1:216-1787(+)